MIDPERRVRLVRGFVPGESHVAVDPEHRPPGITDELGRNLREAHVEFLDQRLHRVGHVADELFAPRLEPLAPVVPLQPAQIRERFRPKSMKKRHCIVV
jgi:hypothetical protein